MKPRPVESKTVTKRVTDIFKFQRPVFGNGPMLIYNKDHSVEFINNMSDESLAAFGDEYKLYVKATIEPASKKITVHEILPDQGW